MSRRHNTDGVVNSVACVMRSLKLLPESTTVIVGLSGGADSIALITVLSELKFQCIAAHCNFHLRGDESNRDEHYVREFTAKRNIPLEKIDFNVKNYINTLDRPTSIEMACRDLRYKWFDSLKLKYEPESVIAVAHNADDNIETSLLNMIRGTGISGARGMKVINDKGIIRPLLGVYRNEIETYLAEKKISFVTDSTNLESDFNRNRLRNLILPLLYNTFPNARKGLSTSLSILARTSSFLNRAIHLAQKDYFKNNGSIDLYKLAEDEQSSFLLYEWLKQYGITDSQVEDILGSASQSGKRFLCNDGYFLINRGELKHIKENNNNSTLLFNDLFEITIHNGNVIESSFIQDCDTACFDANSIDIKLLDFRYWQNGDKIKPFGMSGSKKVSDIFSDSKISLDLKKHIPLLTYRGEILWVAGLRASRLYPVTNQTKSYIAIRYKGLSFF